MPGHAVGLLTGVTGSCGAPPAEFNAILDKCVATVALDLPAKVAIDANARPLGA